MESRSFDDGMLQKVIKWISMHRKMHICIHDVSGVLQANASLQISPPNRIHNSCFCNVAKSTDIGLRYCLKCKACSIKKAVKERGIYTGQCYLGIMEVIKPVFWNDRLLCVIYVGNLLVDEKRQDIVEKIKRSCLKTGVEAEKLIQALNETERIFLHTVEEYKEVADILSQYIEFNQASGFRLGRKTSSNPPIHTESRHWVVELVENYIHTYYNRDLRLSNLAKLYFVNPQYLCRLFKSETGKNYTDYINQVRLEKGKQRLLSTEEDIVNISLHIGFNNVTYFNRLFKKNTSLTPREFRDLYRNPGR